MAGHFPSYRVRFQVLSFEYPNIQISSISKGKPLVVTCFSGVDFGFGFVFSFSFSYKGEQIAPLFYLCGDLRVVRGTEQRLLLSL